ncbi:hypothetical protein ACP275_04G142300 [Erythranthe tilingii]
MKLSIFVPYLFYTFSISTLISLFPNRTLSLHISLRRPPLTPGKSTDHHYTREKGIFLLWWSTSVLCWVTEASPGLPWYTPSNLYIPDQRRCRGRRHHCLKGSATLPLLNVNINI